MEVLRVILPIVVGATIGYFTNFLAIKMLFRPQKEVRIGKWRVPFTPGIIPKNQPRLAAAIGNAVGSHLINMDSIKESFQKNGTKEKLVKKVATSLYESEACIGDFFSTDENHGELIERFCTVMAGAVTEKVQQMEFKPIISQIGKETLGDLLNHKMVTMLLTEERQDAIYERIAQALQKYIDENGEEMIKAAIMTNVQELENKPIKEIVQAGTSQEGLEHLATSLVDRVAERYGEAMLQAVDVCSVVRERVESMETSEMERLTLSVCNKELQAVINLGALIGAVIGVINIFI
ncbi:MAG: DUF445 family protein [Lachnospiraceae bacterium]|nr:DUF445 family protein [Lachnospiraceae bacterium]MBQ2100562.1 DUF445 family protein [Lachnospiraceae bacterium]MBQ3907235.1 DUF445 family protein [Lachnospiraceae bacterium]MCR4599479.1 DUF445 family protein [Acetatifactor sp.]